ncbi:hypothetical protein DPX16_3709 [Anabarilius grahami]|uniref:Uncharacterized protein n=1 Tax=Anabarilius grahami TaxID=495550 RepID=A0A3N0YPU0_ANAGA|nr:hypothetical protein DPX16_3709 [Anabarilius grahami]
MYSQLRVLTSHCPRNNNGSPYGCGVYASARALYQGDTIPSSMGPTSTPHPPPERDFNQRGHCSSAEETHLTSSCPEQFCNFLLLLFFYCTFYKLLVQLPEDWSPVIQPATPAGTFPYWDNVPIDPGLAGVTGRRLCQGNKQESKELSIAQQNNTDLEVISHVVGLWDKSQDNPGLSRPLHGRAPEALTKAYLP